MGVDIIVLLSAEFVMEDTPLEVDVITGLLQVGAADEDAEVGTREPASLSGWVNAVEVLSPLLVEDTWPTQQRKDSLKHIAPSLHVSLRYAVIPPGVSADSDITAELGGPSDVVASSISELDICSLTGVV